MAKKILALFAALTMMAAGLVLGSSPAQAAVKCYDRSIPRVEFKYDKPASDDDLLLQADLFYKKCEAPDKWWVKAEMFVMTWDTLTVKCTRQFDYLLWELYGVDHRGVEMLKKFRQNCDDTGFGSMSRSFKPNNVPQLHFAKSGTWPGLAPKWRVSVEVVRAGPVVNSHYAKSGAFYLQ